VPEHLSWSHFCHLRKLFSKFQHKIFVIILRDVVLLEKFPLSFSQSYSRISMCNLHWCHTFCTDLTLFSLVLHLNCTALSQSESSNFFICIIVYYIKTLWNPSKTMLLFTFSTFPRLVLPLESEPIRSKARTFPALGSRAVGDHLDFVSHSRPTFGRSRKMFSSLLLSFMDR